MFASLLRILVIVGVSVGAGLIRARDLPWKPDVQAIEKKQSFDEWVRGNRSLTLNEFLNKIDQGAVVIDARPADAYEAGHLLLQTEPPVLNVPPEDFEANVNRLMELLGLPLVLYCTSNTCDYAEELYSSLQGLGFVDIWIYFPGWEGIVEAGLPTATGPDTWTGFGSAPSDGDLESSPDEDASDPNIPENVEP